MSSPPAGPNRSANATQDWVQQALGCWLICSSEKPATGNLPPGLHVFRFDGHELVHDLGGKFKQLENRPTDVEERLIGRFDGMLCDLAQLQISGSSRLSARILQ